MTIGALISMCLIVLRTPSPRLDPLSRVTAIAVPVIMAVSRHWWDGPPALCVRLIISARVETTSSNALTAPSPILERLNARRAMLARFVRGVRLAPALFTPTDHPTQAMSPSAYVTTGTLATLPTVCAACLDPTASQEISMPVLNSPPLPQGL